MILGRKTIGTVAYLAGLPAVLEEFAWSWSQMIQYNAELLCTEKQIVHYDRARISDHAPARNSLVSRFLGDWLVQLDTDHCFEPDLVARLVRTADEYGIDVLTAIYQLRSHPYAPLLFRWVGEDTETTIPLVQPMLVNDPSRLRVCRIGSAGAGCLFVRRSVFERIGAIGESAFDRIHPLSEDHSFFLRCKRLDIKVWAAPGIQCHHLRVSPVTPDMLDSSGFMPDESAQVEGYANG
jgi:hypothetical protein